MPYYAFHLNVPAQPEVVAERIRRVVSPAPNFLGALSSSWKPRLPTTTPFLGSVDNLSFRIRRNIQYRNSFLPLIRGKIVATPTGSRLNVFMYMHPFSFIFMLLWFGFLVLIESRVADANIARSFVPIAMAVFGLALSLGGFYFEALKVMPLLSEAVFNPEITTAPAPDLFSQQLGIPSRQGTTLSLNRVAPVVVGLVGVACLVLFLAHEAQLRGNPAVKTAMNLVSSSPEATVALGTPIKVGPGMHGIVHDFAASGYAILTIQVSGPSGKGTVYVMANRSSDGWGIERAVLEIASRSQKIDLTPPTKPDAFHYPASGRVYLLPLDETAATLLKDLPAYYKARLGLDVALLPTQNLPPEAFDAQSKQLMAEKVLALMAQNHRDITLDPDNVIVGLTSEDMNIQTSGWAFATNYRHGRYGVISTARFRGMPWYAGANPEALAVRARKMITKNLVMLHYPVDLSSDDSSAVANAIFTTSDVDSMGESVGGQNGNAQLISSSNPPCVTILQGPNGKQGWRLGCMDDPERDSRFESFETYPGIPLLVVSHVAFSFQRQPAFPFVRKYRPQDDRTRAFGIGATDSFDIFPVGDSRTFSWIDLVLPDGGLIHYTRSNQGSGLANAKLRARSYMSSPFSLSTLEWNGNGWDLSTQDDWTYKFPSSGPDRTWQQSALTGIQSDSGGAFSIQRGGAGELQQVRAPDGETIAFTNDAGHRITSGTESSGHAIQYEYDAAGRLMHLHDSETGDEFYEYDPVNRLTVVRDAQHRPLLTNTYGFLGEIRSQTLADGEQILYETGFREDRKMESLKLTFPNGYTIFWLLTRNGLTRNWPQGPSGSSSDLHHP